MSSTSKTTRQETIEDPMLFDGLKVSEAEYWEKYYDYPDHRFEWNDGVLEKVPVSNYLQYMLYKWFIKLLESYLESHPIARTVALEVGFAFEREGGKRSIRKPDMGVILNSNTASIADLDRTYKGIYDLCIEAISDSDKRQVERDTVQKKMEYAQAGVKEYFILDPSGEHMEFFRLGRNGRYVPIVASAENIIESQVLPGFRFRLTDLEKRPSLYDLTQDPVYQSYVLLEYQEVVRDAEFERRRADRAREQAELEKQRAELEKQQAELEKQRAELERQRAEQVQLENEMLRAKLTEMGISVDDL